MREARLGLDLVIHFPARLPHGVRVHEAVTLGDLAATVVDLTVGDAAAAPPPAGRSLARFWSASLTQRETEPSIVLAELTPGMDEDARIRSIILDRIQYIENPDGTKEVYRLDTDPTQEVNLISATPWRLRAHEYASRLRAALGCVGSDC